MPATARYCVHRAKRKKICPMDTPPDFQEPELFQQLRGAQGDATRQRLLAQLAELQGRLQATQRTGLDPQAYIKLEATLLAVECARATLQSPQVDAARG